MTRTSSPRRALIYTRISRDDTGEGLANDRQEDKCREYASARGWEVVGVENDISVSGYAMRKRAAWEQVLQRVQADECDVILAWHLDRITRNMADLERMIEVSESTGVGIATVTGDIDLTTDVGRMVARILGAVARAEVERKAARQRVANQQRAAEGKPWTSGFRCFGYERNGELVTDEAEAVRQAFADVLDEDTSMREIARRWNAAGLKGRGGNTNGKGWSGRGVASALVNPRYAGLATYQGEVVGVGEWEAIVTPADHAEMKARLTDPARRTNHNTAGAKPEHLLSAIAVCSRCGGTVHSGGVRHGQVVYRCNSDHVSTPRDEADEYVRKGVETALRVLGLSIESDGSSDARKAALGEVDALQGRLGELAEAFANGAIDADQLAIASKSLRAKIEQVETVATAPTGQVFAKPSDMTREIVERFTSGNMDRQRSILQRIATVTFTPKGRGKRNVPIEDQVTCLVRLADGDRVNVADL